MINDKCQMINTGTGFRGQFSVISSQIVRFRISEIRLSGDRKLKTEHRVSDGFTLIELILYIAISSIFLTSAIYFTWDLMYGRVKSYTQQEVNQNIRFAEKRIVYEIRNALTITGTGGFLSLTMSDTTRNPTIIDVSGGRLRIGYGISGPCPTTAPCFLTDNDVMVSGVTFTDFSSGANSKHVRFTLTVSKTGGRSEFQESQTIMSSAEVRSH